MSEGLTPAPSLAAGFEIILPYIRPLEPYIRDPEVSEILVNATASGPVVYVERVGVLSRVDVEIDAKQLKAAVKAIARRLGLDVSETQPILDARLPDGSRVAAVLPPCSVGGVTIAIRKYVAKHFTLTDLIANGSLTAEVATLLAQRVRDCKNILISGGTGTGKTTLLNIVADAIPDSDRVVVIEDTAELDLRKPNVVRLEARRADPRSDPITIGDLLKTTLRLRPDRIIVGEVRREEAWDLLQALGTGHPGSLSTIHANSSSQALSRLATCVLAAKMDLPYAAIRSEIADSFQVLVHIERKGGRRFVRQVLQLDGYNPDIDKYQFQTLYDRQEPPAIPVVVAA